MTDVTVMTVLFFLNLKLVLREGRDRHRSEGGIGAKSRRMLTQCLPKKCRILYFRFKVLILLAGDRGFEPLIPDSESGVIPFHQSPTAPAMVGPTGGAAWYHIVRVLCRELTAWRDARIVAGAAVWLGVVITI